MAASTATDLDGNAFTATAALLLGRLERETTASRQTTAPASCPPRFGLMVVVQGSALVFCIVGSLLSLVEFGFLGFSYANGRTGWWGNGYVAMMIAFFIWPLPMAMLVTASWFLYAKQRRILALATTSAAAAIQFALVYAFAVR